MCRPACLLSTEKQELLSPPAAVYIHLMKYIMEGNVIQLKFEHKQQELILHLVSSYFYSECGVECCTMSHSQCTVLTKGEPNLPKPNVGGEKQHVTQFYIAKHQIVCKKFLAIHTHPNIYSDKPLNILVWLTVIVPVLRWVLESAG